MQTVGMFDLRRKFSEPVKHASAGERIRITRRGKLLALIIPPESAVNVTQAFADVEEARKHRKPLKGKQIIEKERP